MPPRLIRLGFVFGCGPTLFRFDLAGSLRYAIWEVRLGGKPSRLFLMSVHSRALAARPGQHPHASDESGVFTSLVPFDQQRFGVKLLW